MDTTLSLIERSLLELQDPRTTPEMALQTLASPGFFLGVNSGRDNDIYLIFLAYMKHIMTKLPEAYVNGVWEYLLQITVMYSRNLSCIQNPYIRLEIFRLIMILWRYSIWIRNESVSPKCESFICSINEIQPHHMYPDGDLDEMLYSVKELNYTFNFLCGYKMKYETFAHIEEEIQFLFQCVRLVGVFASLVASKLDPKEQIAYKRNSICLLRNTIDCYVRDGRSKPCMLFPNMLSRTYIASEFQKVISHSSNHCYAVEDVGEETSAIITSKRTDLEKTKSMVYFKDALAKDLKVCPKPRDLPKLLMSRQIHGPTHMCQYALLLCNLETTNENRENSTKYRNESRSFDSDNDFYNSESNSSNVINASETYGEQMQHVFNEDSWSEDSLEDRVAIGDDNDSVANNGSDNDTNTDDE